MEAPNRLAAVVPVKSLDASKSRLLPRLGREGARRLSVAMLADVLEVLLSVPRLVRVAVVTPDASVAEAARRCGAEALLREDPGLNASVEAACAEIAAGLDGALVVLGDVAGARAPDVEALLDASPRVGVALAPSSDGGTAALVRRPHDVVSAGFGPESAKRHRELAAAAGVAFAEVPLHSLSLDLDEPEDLEAFLAREGGGRRTRELLLELLAP